MGCKKNPSLRVAEAKQNLRLTAAEEPQIFNVLRETVRSYPETSLLAGFVSGIILGASAEARQAASSFLTALVAGDLSQDACSSSDPKKYSDS